MCSYGLNIISFLLVEFMNNINKTFMENMLSRLERLNSVEKVIQKVLKRLTVKDFEALNIQKRNKTM